MVITWDETIAERKAAGSAEGEARGRAAGKVEGRVDGQRMATREAIELALKGRGISVPPSERAKLEAIEDLSKLHELLEQAMDAAPSTCRGSMLANPLLSSRSLRSRC